MLKRIEGTLSVQPFELVLVLTVILLMIHSPGYWYAKGIILVFCILTLVAKDMLNSPWVWFTLFCFTFSAALVNWHEADNHKYLLSYWCLAIAGTLALPEAKRYSSLATQSRLLIGLCMAFAVIWKVSTPEYTDSSFFEFELLTDKRFSHLTHFLAGMELESLSKNRDLIDFLKKGHLKGYHASGAQLVSNETVQAMSYFLTWWTVAIESALAFLFLLPNRKWVSLAGNTLLIAFAISTYSVATVKGFAWLLLIMGIAQVPQKSPFRAAYLLTFLLMQLYVLPYGKIFRSFF